MGSLTSSTRWRFQRAAQITAMGIFAALALTAVGTTLFSAAGLQPWLAVPLALSDGQVIAAGPAIQIALTVLAVLLCAYMPANLRILQLENSHRSFRMRMEDVANAYWAAHEADRSGVFKMKSEFDSVRERLMFLRDHPDLGYLEPDILEIAAQMSRTSEDLARRYSDEAVERARNFLAEREHEAANMQTRIEAAQTATHEMRRWLDRVEIEEDIAQSQINRLRDDLDALLPALGLEVHESVLEASSDVIHLPSSRAPQKRTIPAE